MADVVKREIGSARGARVNRALDEQNRALTFPQSSVTFGKMLREDAKVRSVFRAVTLPIRRANWQLDGSGADPVVVEHVAGDLSLRIKGDDPNKADGRVTGRVSWEKHLEQAVHAIAYGHMFFEQVYRVGPDGREHLWKLAPRWPGTIGKINVASDGGLDSVEQRGVDGGERAVIPVDRLVAYVFDDVGSQWTGTSIFRPAYKHWRFKDDLLNLEARTLDRNGMGVPVYFGSDLAMDPDADLEYGQDVATNLRAGEYSGASIPAGGDLKLLGVNGQIVSAREAITYHDAQIAVVALANFLNLEGQGGSYALASTQSDFFNQSEQTTAEWVADVANQHVIADLVRVAFPDYAGPLPRLTFDAIGSRRELTAQDLSTLVRDKVVLMDPPTEGYVRDRFDLPASQPLSEALRAKKARQEMEQDMGVTLTNTAVGEQIPLPIEGEQGVDNE